MSQHLQSKGNDAGVKPHTRLSSHLTDLGVEAAQDWLLLLLDDYVVTVINEGLFTKINANYPQAFSINGAKFRVQYKS